MNKQVLSIEQMLHLEKMEVDTNNASMCWIKTPKGRQLAFNDEWAERRESLLDPILAYTLQDVLDALPEEIKFKRKDYHIEMWLRDGEWSIAYLHFTPDDTLYAHLEQDKEILKAAYEMLCWCIKEGHITKN